MIYYKNLTPSWAHLKSRIYNLKSCNFFFGASLVPGFGEKEMFLTQKGCLVIPPPTKTPSEE